MPRLTKENSVDQSEKGKTAKNEWIIHQWGGIQTIVGLANEAIAIVSSGQKNQVKRRERFCKNSGTSQW